jgi:hypothetical protein
MTAILDVKTYSLVEIGHCFGGDYCPHHQSNALIIAYMMEAVSTTETLASFYKTSRPNIPK